jgi:DNA-directed RNA polymerase subunit RPC12/RpoP
MEKEVEPWHALVFICAECGGEFQHKSDGLHSRFCSECNQRRGTKKILELKGPGAANDRGNLVEFRGI